MPLPLIIWVVPFIILGVIILPQMIRILRIRTRRDFPSRKIIGRERAGPYFPNPDRRSNSANGFARRDHQRREAGGDDA